MATHGHIIFYYACDWTTQRTFILLHTDATGMTKQNLPDKWFLGAIWLEDTPGHLEHG